MELCLKEKEQHILIAHFSAAEAATVLQGKLGLGWAKSMSSVLCPLHLLAPARSFAQHPFFLKQTLIVGMKEQDLQRDSAPHCTLQALDKSST